MYRVTPSIGSTRANDINNIRPFTLDQNKYRKKELFYLSSSSFVLNLSKTISPNGNTLDSFVIKRGTNESSEEPVLKTDVNKTPKKTSTKRTQSTIEDYMFKDTKSSGKRFKK